MSSLLKLFFQSNFATNIWSILSPYKKVASYATYIETTWKIVENPKQSKIKIFQAITFSILYYSFLNCLFYFLPFSSTVRLILCDVVYLKQQGTHNYFIYAIFCLMISYFYCKIYLYPNLKVNGYLFEALFVDDEHSNKVSFWFIKMYCNMSINEIMVNIAWIITNGLNLFKLLLYFIFTFVNIAIIKNTIKNIHVFTTFIGVSIYFPIHLFHLLNKLSFWLSYAHILIHSASIALILFIYILLQLKQHYQQLKLTLSMHSQTQYDYQKRFYTSVHIYKTLFEVNKLFSGIFLTFLLINMPIHAFFIMTLATKTVSPIFKWAAVFIIFQQAMCILIFHIFIAHLNTCVQQGGKILICFTGKNMELSIRCRFLIWLHTLRLYSENPYGITYGKLQLQVTMKTFLNVSN